MDFCIISPIAGLNRYSILSKTHLVLPHIYDEDYWNFYEGRRSEGDRIILDNGAYEGREFHEIRFTSLLRYLKPQVAVLPDYPLEWWVKTHRASMAFLDRWAEKFPEVEWMYVPQAEEKHYGDLIHSMKEVLDNEPSNRVKWIGLPRNLTTHFLSPLNRIDAVRVIKEEPAYENVKIHCLGMAAGNVHELHYLAQLGVDSIDSSAPVWRGWNGYNINDPNWPDIPVNFDWLGAGLREAFQDKHELILHNLKECGIDTSSVR